jgi:P4 family phage/plasmid primase-like protien
VLRPRDIALVIQAMGYCLIPDYSIQKAILLNGSGLNGKGTLGRLMAKAFGDENISSESLKALNTDKFSAANLYGKLINIDMDLTAEAVHEDSVFKKLTGGDMIPAERKFQNRFEFRNIARLFFGCNDIPQHKKGGFAYFRRWIIVDFPVKFSGEAENKSLDAKLQTPGELSGLLNLCLEGLHWLLETKTYFYDKTPEQVGEEYLIKSNSVMAFMKEYTIPADDYVTTSNLYQAYITWGKYMHIKKVEASNTFGQMLKHGGYNQVRPYVDGKQTPAYEGFVIDYTKLAKIESMVNQGISRVEETTQNTLNQTVYKHWYNKDCELSKVSRVLPQIIQCIIHYVHENPLRNDNDIVELLSRTYLEHNPTYSTNNTDNSEQNDMPEQLHENITEKKALLMRETEQTRFERETSNSNGNGNGNGNGTITNTIMEARQRYEREKGPVNSANIIIFCIWTCDQFKPQWHQGSESGYYQPSAIKGLAMKIIGITPGPKPAE